MTMETALRTRLKQDGAVAAIVGTRVDWDERPQRSQYPALVLELVFDDRTQHMTGFDSFRATRVQISCFATTATQKVTLRNAVVAAVAPAASVDNVEFLRAQGVNVISRNDNTPTGFVHCDLVDLTVWHDS